MKKNSILLAICAAFMLSLSGFTLLHNRSKTIAKTFRSHSAISYKVVIDKSHYELKVYDDEGWLLTYPVVFGTSEMTDKMMEGDRRTPEGSFKIIAKKIHKDWGPFLLLDYPTKESLEKFNERKHTGLIPPTAKPGGGIGIHATRMNEDRFVDFYYNWTLGCISTKREYARELYDMLPVGTEVEIKK
jgi:murein L,D-transpeptidase YafK